MDKVQYYTYREIKQQPDTWTKEYGNILSEKERISGFISRYAGSGYEVIFTGAGTSAYIGDMLAFLYKVCRDRPQDEHCQGLVADADVIPY